MPDSFSVQAAELATDEHLNVRKVAIVSLENCARGLSTGTAAGQLRAAVMSVVQKASRADWVNEMGLEAVLLPLLSIVSLLMDYTPHSQGITHTHLAYSLSDNHVVVALLQGRDVANCHCHRMTAC